MEASVLVMRCGTSKKMFGVRIQKMEDDDWYRTWAFKLSEKIARSEGYDQSTISGNLNETNEFPGCPYCGSYGFYQCGACQKIVCWNSEDTRVTCPWCGASADVVVADERFTVDTDAF